MQREIPLTLTTSRQDVSGNERLVNLYAEQATSGKYKYKLINTPGLITYVELPTSPVLGMASNESRCIAVTPTKMYEIFSDKTFVELGDLQLSGRVSIAGNGVQVVVVDGIRGYYYDDQTGVLQRITAPGFYPARTVTSQDGYFIFDRKGTNEFYISDLDSVSFDPNKIAEAEGQPDNVVGVLSDHRELFIFGDQTIEVWYNSGELDFPFARNQAAFVEKGCAAPYSIAKLDNSVFFLGSDLIVYEMKGYQPVRISTHGVEASFKKEDLTLAHSYTYQAEGHRFYVLTVPSINLTWCFDLDTRAWHIRTDYERGIHRANATSFFDKRTLVGDRFTGKIYEYSNYEYTDDGDPIRRQVVLPTVNLGRERVTVDSLELDISSGVGLDSGYGNDPEFRISTSRDGGITYGQNYKVARMGKKGEYYRRAKANRFGLSREFTFKIETTDPVPIDIGGAWIEIRSGK